MWLRRELGLAQPKGPDHARAPLLTARCAARMRTLELEVPQTPRVANDGLG